MKYSDGFGRIVKWVFFICLLMMPMLAYAQITDWQALAQQAIETDPRVLSARANLSARSFDVKGAQAAYYPTLSGKGYFGSTDNDDPLVRDGEKHTWGVELEQPVPLFGKESAKVKNAKAALRGEVALLNKIEQDVASDFFGTALRLRTALKIFQFHEHLVSLLSEQLIAFEESVDLGGAHLPELRHAQSRLAQSISYKEQAEVDVTLQRASMRRLLAGRPIPPPMTENEFDLLQTLTPKNYDIAVKTAASFSPALLKARAELSRAAAEEAEAKSNYWPDLSINIQTEHGRFDERSMDTWGAFVSLNQPIFTGGAISAKANSATHKKRAAIESLRQETIMLEERINAIWLRWKAYGKSVKYWIRAEKEEKKALTFIKEQVDKGVGTLITFMKAQEDWTNIRSKGVEKRLERDLTWVSLLKEIGILQTFRPY